MVRGGLCLHVPHVEKNGRREMGGKRFRVICIVGGIVILAVLLVKLGVFERGAVDGDGTRWERGPRKPGGVIHGKTAEGRPAWKVPTADLAPWCWGDRLILTREEEEDSGDEHHHTTWLCFYRVSDGEEIARHDLGEEGASCCTFDVAPLGDEYVLVYAPGIALLYDYDGILRHKLEDPDAVGLSAYDATTGESLLKGPDWWKGEGYVVIVAKDGTRRVLGRSARRVYGLCWRPSDKALFWLRGPVEDAESNDALEASCLVERIDPATGKPLWSRAFPVSDKEKLDSLSWDGANLACGVFVAPSEPKGRHTLATLLLNPDTGETLRKEPRPLPPRRAPTEITREIEGKQYHIICREVSTSAYDVPYDIVVKSLGEAR
jgi:hypothetical protein